MISPEMEKRENQGTAALRYMDASTSMESRDWINHLGMWNLDQQEETFLHAWWFERQWALFMGAP